MGAVVLASPGPVFFDPNAQPVQANATLTATASAVFSAFGAKQVTLIVNVKAAPTGTTPTLTYTLQEVDPGDQTTVIGTAVSGAVINGVTIQQISLPVTMGGFVKVTWTITGTTPSFTQVYATIMEKVGGPLVVQDANGVDRLLSADTTGKLVSSSEGATGSAVPARGTFIEGKDPSGNAIGIQAGAEGSLGSAIMANEFSVQSNATLTATGSQLITKNFYGVQQINLIVNVKAAPTGTTPTITFSIQEVDPGDGTTVMGTAVSTLTINAIGVYTAVLNNTTSSLVKVSWTVTGTTPSFTQVYVTVVSKSTPTTQAISTSPLNVATGIATGTVITSATANTAVRASTYNEQTVNAQRSISSANVNDTSAGTGARQVKITYYDQTGAGPFTETVTMNGTTAVNTAATNICFIERMDVVSVGSAGSNVGVLTLFIATAGGGGTLAQMNATDAQTFWAHHYVATGKTCNITGLSGNNTNGSNGSVLTLRAKTLNVATAVESLVSDYVRVGGGTAQPVREYNQLIKVTGPARILCYEACEGTPSITTRAAFDYYDQ